MAPNLASTSILNRAKVDADTNGHSKMVRTEFIVQNIYGYLLEDEYFLQRVPAENSAEKAAMEALKNVVDVFKDSYSASMAELSSSLEVTTETMGSVILGVSNELFCEGINWSKIATFFVFASELSIQCLRKNFPETVIEETMDCCLKFVRDSLQKWIDDHNGWEGIIDFASGHKKTGRELLQSTDSDPKKTGWAKNAIYGTVRVLGALAHIATFADPALSFPMNSPPNITKNGN